MIRLPEPVRDSYSGALIFIPTAQEQMYMESKRALDRELAEVAVVGQSVGEMIEQQRDVPAVDDATAASARKHA